MTRTQKHMISQICQTYPDVKPFLEFQNPFELLIAVILSAQCTDAMVNKITPELFARYPDAAAMSQAPLEELERLVYKTGFFRAKALHIQETSQILKQKYAGSVPSPMEELTDLPGVGRKTANVIRGSLFKMPAIIVDTHFRRVVRRLGLTEAQEPVAIEKELLAIIPEDQQYTFSMAANVLGRVHCQARQTDCLACCVGGLCPSSAV